MPDYHSSCLLLGLSTLEKRREEAQCSFVAKMLRGKIDALSLLANLNINAAERIIRTGQLFRLPRSRSRYADYELITDMYRSFNKNYQHFDFSLTHLNYIQQLL